MDWIQRMNLVIDYIENNLDGEIEENRIAELSANPKGMFQRIFTVLTDMSLSEYIRKRRLTQAAFDIQNTDEKIIDIALKYGYSSADTFSFAFKNFHGITPSDTKKPDIQLQFFYPFVFEFKLSAKGGNDMQSRIIENVNVKVEIGKVYKSNNEIVVEFGRSITPVKLKEIIVDNVIELDKKVSVNSETNIAEYVEPFDVLVNGRLAAKGNLGTNNGISCIKIIEVIDKERNIANLEEGNFIEFDKNVELKSLDILANGKLIAKGESVIHLNRKDEAVVYDGYFNVRIKEVIKTD